MNFIPAIDVSKITDILAALPGEMAEWSKALPC